VLAELEDGFYGGAASEILSSSTDGGMIRAGDGTQFWSWNRNSLE
jgi:hypothetical protein